MHNFPRPLIIFASALILFIAHSPLHAQSLILRLVVAPNVPGKIAHWSTDQDAIKALVTNSGDAVDARFESELYRDGQLVVETRYTDMPIVRIPKGQSTFTAEKIIPPTAITYLADPASTGGWLLAGKYEMSVRLCAGGIEMGLCMFTKQTVLVAPPAEPALLLKPADRSEINTDQPTLFSWNPSVSVETMRIHYVIQIYHLEPDMTPRQALQEEFRVLSHEDTTTQFILNPGKGITKKLPTRYVWTVTTVSEQNEALAKSEAFVFLVKD